MSKPANTEAEMISSLAAAFQGERKIGETPVVILPEGYRAHDLTSLLPAPTRKKGVTTLLDVGSFIAVVNDQKGDATRLFSTLNPPSFTAVFNATAVGTGWGDHRASYDLPLSSEWKAWDDMDNDKVNQVTLAQFVENNLEDVVSPDGATLLEICRTLQAKKSVEFASGIRLSNGENQLTFKEEINGTAGNGNLNIPEIFKIGIPVFENGEKWSLDVRLRYRIDGPKLTMWIELVRPHKVLEAAVNDVRQKIAAETELQVLNGHPPRS